MDVMLPKRNVNFFVIIFEHLWPFSLCFTSFLLLLDHMFSVCSSPNCGRICGQKRFPAWTGDFHHPRPGSVLRFRLVGL